MVYKAEIMAFWKGNAQISTHKCSSATAGGFRTALTLNEKSSWLWRWLPSGPTEMGD